MAVRRLFSVLVLLGLLLPLKAGPLEEALRAAHPETLKPGYGICLFDARGPLWSHCEGLSDEAAGTAFSRDTVLRMGGSSDLFTVALALRLADAGKLDPEGPVAAWLPELAAGGPTLEQIGQMKIRLLMAHLTGTDASFFMGYQGYDPFANLATYLKDANLKFPPGVKYLRSGAMIDLLGLILERAAGMRFEALVEAEVFRPLDLASASFHYRASPLLASLRYKSAAPDSYATRLPGFRETVAPSGSLQCSLRDMAAFGSALLGDAFLSGPSRKALFSPQSEAARRQGQGGGCPWRLGLPGLGHLGRVAWYSGKHLSHRNVIVLLPELGLGAVCATNAWNIIDRDTILPMAVAVLKAHAREALGLREPEPAPVRPVPLPAGMRPAGVYAAPTGVYEVGVGRRTLTVSSSVLDAVLAHRGRGAFVAASEGPLEGVVYRPPGSLELAFRDGMRVEAVRLAPASTRRRWLLRQGTYRLAEAHDGALYAFTLGAIHGVPVISGDDGIAYLVEPGPDGSASVLCHEGSRLSGLTLRPLPGKEILLGDVRYRRTD